jgi:hypothetical protein
VSNPSNYLPGEYEGLSGSFAAACREVDQKLRLHQSKRQAAAREQNQLPAAAVPENIIHGIDLMNVDQLDKFLIGRPKAEIENILSYITGQLS